MADNNVELDLLKKVEDLARFPDMNPGPVLRVSHNGDVLLANKGAREIFDKQSMVGLNWIAECPDMTEDIWSDIRKSDKSVGFEADVAGRCYLFTHVAPKEEDFVFVFGSDVTQIKLIERELEEQKTKLADMAKFPDMNPGPVLRLNRDGEIVLANKAAREIFSATSLVRLKWQEVCPDIDSELWSEISSCGTSYGHEADVNERCYLFTHVCPEGGDFLFVFGSDVTQIKLIEREIEAQKAQLAKMARFPDMNPGPVLKMDFEGQIGLSNIASKQVFGEMIEGGNWIDECPGMNKDKWENILKNSETEPILIEASIGSRVFIFTHRKEPDAQNIFVFGTEITKQKLAEKSLKQSEKMATLGTLAAGVAHELNNPAAATKRASENLKDEMSALEKAHVVLNELNLIEEEQATLYRLDKRARHHSSTPSSLSAIELSSREGEVEDWLEEKGIEDPWDLAPNIAAMEFDEDELDELFDTIQTQNFGAILAWLSAVFPVYSLLEEISEGSSRISEIVGALKNYSFVGQAPIQEVDIHKGLDNTLVILRSKFKTGLTIERDYCESLPLITAYGSELNQVWTNLLDNAIDAVGENGTIIIRTKTDYKWVEVQIEDNGSGISPENLSQIFDPFFTTKTIGKGTGLGLSTSFGIVKEKHKGEMEATSEPGRTIFTVRLPLKV